MHFYSKHNVIILCLLVLTISVAANIQKGVSWVGGPVVNAEDIQHLVDNNVEWIVQTPFGWQHNLDDTKVHLSPEGYLWGEGDTGLIVTNRLAERQGIKTLLKPHVWLINAEDGKWRGQIEMNSAREWAKWFLSYEQFIMHYARLAERESMPILCIGTELHVASTTQEEHWRKLIAKIRKVYSGQLTYAANWDREYEEITFWDDLDYIGIQAYFPLAEKDYPSTEEITKGWKPYEKDITDISKKYGKPILFTEIGFKSTADGATRPWEWPQLMDKQTLEVSLTTQKNAYTAFFDTFWDKEYLAGIYWWKWFPKHPTAGGEENFGFTPQNKPAQDVLRKWYGKDKE